MARTLHDLLPIPEGTRRPHAYQVVGLEPGESDPAKLKAAIASTVEQLKAAKDQTDAGTWNKAAKLVKQAGQILLDPAKKSELDARFGIVATDAARPAVPVTESAVESSGASPSPPTDSPAAVLPASDPLASVLPTHDPLAPATIRTAVVPPSSAPPSLDTSPPAPLPSEAGSAAAEGDEASGPDPDESDKPPLAAFGMAAPTASGDAAAAPVFIENRSKEKPRRRRKSIVGTLMFSSFMLVMLATIALLSYFLFFGPGQVAISKSDGGLQIRAGGPPADDEIAINPPQTLGAGPLGAGPEADGDRPAPRLPRDNVMGRLAGNVPPPTRPDPEPDAADPPRFDRPASESVDSPTLMEQGSEEPADTAAEMNGEMKETPNAPPTPADEEPMNGEPVDAEPMNEGADSPPASKPITDEMIAAADQRLDEVADLIRTAQWKAMKPAATALVDSQLTESQRERAEALYELADLASFYRGGIERGVATLQVGNDFAVTDNFRVIIVEVADDLLVVRFNAKNRSYTFDEFPFALAHKLASFSMAADDPTTEAAKAVYQAIAPKATPGYRDEAIGWLESISAEVKGADPQRAAETLRDLLAPAD